MYPMSLEQFEKSPIKTIDFLVSYGPIWAILATRDDAKLGGCVLGRYGLTMPLVLDP